jgi:hypothetical protein
LIPFALCSFALAAGCGARVTVGDGPGGSGVSPEPAPGVDDARPAIPDDGSKVCGVCGPGSSCDASTGGCVEAFRPAGTLSFDYAQRDAVFGAEMARTEARLAVSAFNEGTAVGGQVGAVYLFERDERGVWLRGQRLEAASPVAGMRFGFALALTDEVVAVASGRGVHLFELRSGHWTEVQLLDGRSAHDFGYALAFSGATLAVGTRSGVELFERKGGLYTLSGKLFEGRRIRSLSASPRAVAATVGVDDGGSCSPSPCTSHGGGSAAWAAVRTERDWGEPTLLREAAAGLDSIPLQSVSVDGLRVAVATGFRGASSRQERSVEIFALANGRAARVGAFLDTETQAERRAFGHAISLVGERFATDGRVFDAGTGQAIPLAVDLAWQPAVYRVPRAPALLSADDVVFAPTDHDRVVVERFAPPRVATSVMALTATEHQLGSSVRARADGNAVLVRGTRQWLLFEREERQEREGGERHGFRFKQAFAPPVATGSAANWGAPALDGSILAMGWHNTRSIRVYERGSDGLWSRRGDLAFPAPAPGYYQEYGGWNAAVAVSDGRIAAAEAKTLLVYERAADGAFAVKQRLELRGEVADLAFSGDRLVAIEHSGNNGYNFEAFADVLGPAGARAWRRIGDPVDRVALHVALSGRKLLAAREGELVEYALEDDRLEVTAKRPDAASAVPVGVGDGWLVGYPGEGTGIATFYRGDRGTLVPGLTLRSPTAKGAANFGLGFAATSRTLFVGAPGEEDGSGRVHVFERRIPLTPPR